MNPASVGLYNAAFTVAALMGFVPELFRQLFLPLITREYSNKNFEVIKQLSKQSAKWIFMMNLPVFIILFVYPGLILNILFGAEYVSAYNALRILSVAGIFSCLTLLLTNMILMTGRSKVILSNLLVFSLLNILLNIFLVPLYGINGAAMSTTLATVGMSMALFIEVKYYTGIIPLRTKMLNILLVSIIPAAIVIFLRKFIENSPINIIFTGLFFILSYLCLLLITNSFDRNDWMILKTIKNKILINRNK
jgi:O-antigen/teichoic acid export membrane protein